MSDSLRVHASLMVSRCLALVAASLIIGPLFAILYGKVSNQRSIRIVKRNIYRLLLESLLFRDSFTITVQAQAQLLIQSIRYLSCVVKPLLVLFIPGVLVFGLIQGEFGVRPLRVGEEAIVRVQFASQESMAHVTGVGSAGLILSPPVRIPAAREVIWRVSGKEAGSHEVSFMTGDGKRAHSQKVEVGPDTAIFSRTVADFMAQGFGSRLILPAPFYEIELAYPEEVYRIFGVELRALTLFCIVSFFSGWIAARSLRIEL